MRYICGIDVGGTFTDCAVIDEQGEVSLAKSPSTPGDFSRGMFDVLEVAANRLGLATDEFLASIDALFHGTTVATNAMVERKGVPTAMVMTGGHRDALHIMRGAGRTAGLSPDEYLQVSIASKPDPLVPRRLIGEANERVDAKGEAVVPLNEDGAREVVRGLLGKGAVSIGVSLLWSFRNPDHELRLREIIEEESDGEAYVTLSHELLPKLGEYERAAGTAINSYIGPLVRDYLDDLRTKATDRGMDAPIVIMQASGGLAESKRVVEVALQTIGSGPVAGVAGSSVFGRSTGYPNIICTDVGGTTFDVGLVVDGQPLRQPTTILGQYEYSLPQVGVRSVGAGGGSIAWVDPVSGALRVGPQSAGASPGPAAYGQGGTEPTVTDANLVLGYIDPDNFLGGDMKLDIDLAQQALERVGSKLGMDSLELAAGIVTIIEAHMAELIRQMSVQAGYDPRDFVVYAYGGAGPTHGVGYASELGAQSVIVPLLDLGAVWSAYGVASSDLVELVEQTEIMPHPFDVERVKELVADLEQTATERLVAQGVSEDGVGLRRIAHIRYSAQINEVEVGMEDGEIDEASLERLVQRFHERYEALYGKGSGFAGAGMELVTLAAEGRGRLPAQRPAGERPTPAKANGAPAERGTREVFWPRQGERLTSRIFDGTTLAAGHTIEGPAIAELPHTTVVIPPGHTAAVDDAGDLTIQL